MQTLDQLLLYSFTKKHDVLVWLIQRDLVISIHEPPDNKVIYLELVKNVFNIIGYDNLINRLCNSNLDYQIRIVGKRIFIFLFPKIT
jgi:hypothetical protein